MDVINLYPGGGVDGLPPSFYPSAPEGTSYQMDTNGNVITDINGNPQLASTALTITNTQTPITSTSSNITAAKAALPAPNIIPGINNTVLFIGLGTLGIIGIYLLIKEKQNG